jgi:Universal stress protein family
VHASGSGQGHAPVPLELELRALVRTLAEEGIDADAVVRAAEPAQAIVDVVAERDADLIVMASHQRHGLDRWLNGSVTEQVLSLSRTPLLVVPAGTTNTTPPVQRILIPLDGTPVGEAPLDFLRERATTRPIDVLLVRIVSDAPIVVGVGPGLHEHAAHAR